MSLLHILASQCVPLNVSLQHIQCVPPTHSHKSMCPSNAFNVPLLDICTSPRHSHKSDVQFINSIAGWLLRFSTYVPLRISKHRCKHRCMNSFPSNSHKSARHQTKTNSPLYQKSYVVLERMIWRFFDSVDTWESIALFHFAMFKYKLVQMILLCCFPTQELMISLRYFQCVPPRHSHKSMCPS